MTTEQITEFKRLAKLEGFKKDGYVYVGKGQIPTLVEILNTSIYRRVAGEWCSGYGGAVFEFDYYIEKSAWDKLFGVPVKKVAPKPKAESIDSRVALAKTYIGKDILSIRRGTAHGKVTEVDVMFNDGSIVNGSNLLKDQFKRHIKLHGSIVVLKGEWSDGCTMVRVIDSNEKIDLYVPKVRVNGFDAEEFKSYYQFGCAKISKKMLRDARDFLSTQRAKDNENRATCNREVESVKIGAGDFALEALNELNLD